MRCGIRTVSLQAKKLCFHRVCPTGTYCRLIPLPVCLVRVGADITLLREREVDYDSDRNTRKIAEVLVRKVPDDQQVRAK